MRLSPLLLSTSIVFGATDPVRAQSTDDDDLVTIILPLLLGKPREGCHLNDVLSLDPGGASLPTPYSDLGNTTLFIQNAQGVGDELWKTSGGGATLVADSYPGAESGADTTDAGTDRILETMNGRVYFPAREDAFALTEIWSSNGNDGAATVTGFSDDGDDFQFRDLTTIGDRLWFIAESFAGFGTGEGIWRSDGTTSTQISGNADLLVSVTGVAGDRLVFVNFQDGTGYELWSAGNGDSTPTLIADLAPADDSIDVGETQAVGNRLFMKLYHPDYGEELWVTDATASGTQLVREFVPGPDYGRITLNPNGRRYRDALDVNGTLFFAAETADAGYELWKSDGTPFGTQRVSDLAIGSGDGLARGFSFAAVVGDRYYFDARGPGNTLQIWSAGTDGSLQLEQEFAPRDNGIYDVDGIAMGERLIVAIRDDSPASGVLGIRHPDGQWQRLLPLDPTQGIDPGDFHRRNDGSVLFKAGREGGAGNAIQRLVCY